MADEYTRADALRSYITGASSDGGTQTDHDASLGNYRSSTALTALGLTVTGSPSNYTVDYASGENGTGNGTVTVVDGDTLAWTAPGGSQGTSVAIANGETKVLEDGGDASKYVRVTRTSATDMANNATVALAEVFNNATGFDNISSAEATAGDDEYRCICRKNEHASGITLSNITEWIATLGTQVTSDSAQLGASGAGTITTTGSFADWDQSGFAHIRTSGGATREIVYYSSRTDDTLTVPAAGRGLLGTSAGAGASDDTVDHVPGIRIAIEWPTGDASTGNAQDKTGAGEGSAPTVNTGTPGDAGAVTDWSTGITAADGIDVTGNLASGEIYYLWINRHVPAGAESDPTVYQRIERQFDSA